MIINKVKSFLHRFDHIMLLFSLFMVLSYPIWMRFVFYPNLWGQFLMVLAMVSGISVTFSNSQSRVNIRLWYGMVAAVLSLINIIITEDKNFNDVVNLLQVLYFVILAFFLLRLIFKAKLVTSEILINTISGYLLLGISWSVIVGFWNSMYPGSFNFESNLLTGNFTEIYYSFVTMTTLGYGDLIPIDKTGRAISILISITGSFYTTIVLAIIVGKFISSKNN